MLSKRDAFQIQDYEQVESKGWEKIFEANGT